MTEPTNPVAFDTLIYTDCRLGEGLRGEVGLQFQSRSAGADGAAMAFVQRHLLYEPPAKWMGERRPVEAYPPSFAHAGGEQYATSAGVYLGKEVNGGREGNSLTHTIVTRDPDAYNLVRPAQLFGAPFWTTRPAPTTACPPIPADWEPGPFGIDEAKAFITGQPDGRDRLIALLSTLERLPDPDRRRILFIADDAVLVLRWIAAATLLLPHEQALAVGFKVFSTNPANASQPVIAVHPDWDSTAARVGNDLGYVVFDLVTGEWTSVPPSRHAPGWVDAFCGDHDPFDVVDAIEVAAASGLDPQVAPLFGRVANMREQVATVADAAILVDWLRTTDPGFLAAHRGTIADALTDTPERWPQDILLGLDEIARSGQVPTDRMRSIRLALIRSELVRAATDGAVSGIVLPPLPAGVWGDDDQALAADEVVAALADAPPDTFDPTLRLARRFRLPVTADALGPALDRFVRYWADRPQNYPIGEWPCGPDIERRLDDELSRRAVEHADRIGDAWWKLRWRVSREMRTPLERAVVSAAVKYLPHPQRTQLIGDVLAIAAAADDALGATADAADVLWWRVDPSYDDLAQIAELVPNGTRFRTNLFGRLANDFTHDEYDRNKVALAHRLVERDLWQAPPTIGPLLRNDRKLADLVGDIHNADALPTPYRDVLRQAPPKLISLWSPRIAGALMKARYPVLVDQTVRVLPDGVRDRYLTDLIDDLNAIGTPTHAATALYISYTGALPQWISVKLLKALTRWTNRANGRLVKAAGELVAELGGGWLDLWQVVVDEGRGSNPAVRFTRRIGR
jgi:hypothetical protein